MRCLWCSVRWMLDGLLYNLIQAMPLAKVKRYLLQLFFCLILHISWLCDCHSGTYYTCKHFHIAALRSNPVLQFFHDVMNAAWGCSYLIYEGSFGCRTRWHVGLIQVESPRGETTVHIWSDSYWTFALQCKWGGGRLCLLSGNTLQ